MIDILRDIEEDTGDECIDEDGFLHRDELIQSTMRVLVPQ